MPTRSAQSCAHRAATEALAAEELAGAEQKQAERHLEQCQSCRALFRQRTGQRFPRIRNYTILAEVGRGGFGVVYKALHHSKARTEALKVLFGKTAQRTAYFENEVRLVGKLRHPNIATLYEASLTTTPLYYSMEFVEGQQLDDYLRTHEVSLEQRIELIKSVAGAIDYAHRQGVIHRDLKPQNILIDAQGQPRIIDFGIAKRLGLTREDQGGGGDSPRGPEGALGTYGYIAPEQLAGQDVDCRADVYSLGALLFHVITGQPARLAPQVERLTEVLHERHVSRASDLAEIIACCVSPVPDQRYPSASALVSDLDNYLACRPIRAHKGGSTGYQAARILALTIRNYPLPVQTAATILVAIGLTVSFWQAEAYWISAGGGAVKTALIAFTPGTLEAMRSGRIGGDLPGLNADDRKSYRLLYGRLMERLAEAEPRVIAWDYFFSDPQPQFDAGFVRGVQAVGRPVVVGSQGFDLNGEPMMSPAIRAAVWSWGVLLGARPSPYDRLYVPLVVQRGLNPPTPSLVLAAFAAATHPDCDVSIQADAEHIRLRYRKHQVAGDELRWRDEDQIPVSRSEVASKNQATLLAGDRCRFGRFALESIPDWASRAIPMEEVLTASTAQLREWFQGRVILVGQMLPGLDQHLLRPGELAFGCQFQAVALEQLLSRVVAQRLSQSALALRVCLWCLLAGLLVRMVPVRATWSLRTVGVAAGGAVVVSVAVALGVTQNLELRWALETCIAGCSILAGGAAGLLLRLLHERQLRLAPSTAWPTESAAASTTVLAVTPADR